MTHDQAGNAQPGREFEMRERPTDDPVDNVPMITEDLLGVPAGPAAATFRLNAASPNEWVIQLLAFE